MVKKKAATLFLLVATLSACANWVGRTEEMQNRFYGKHIDEAIRHFGVPKGRVRLSDGSQIIEFVTYRGDFRCEDQFTTDKIGIIVSSRHGGQNGCVTPF